MKRMSLILKVTKIFKFERKKLSICMLPFSQAVLFQAAYNVGGHNVNVDMIQNSILGCHLLRPGQVIFVTLHFYSISIHDGKFKVCYL